MPTDPQPAFAPPEPSSGSGMVRHDILAIVALGLMIGLICRGHFVMPHPDFFEMVDSGRAIIDGRLPPTLKRAPVFSTLVAAAGALLPFEAPERVAAEWINLLMLPLNGVLVYLIGRRWFGGASRWAAVWFLLLPHSLYVTAHVVLEPLLTGLILLTVFLAHGRIGWAYAAAAAATMTRYDAAGLIVGVFVADLFTQKKAVRAIIAGALASLPLAVWLILTAATWSQRSYDHYIRQLFEEPVFAPLWALRLSVRTVLDPQSLKLPFWLGGMVPGILAALARLIACLASIGMVIRLRARDPAAVVGLIAYVCYVGVHALFHFKVEERFGYPVAPLVLLAGGAGVFGIVRFAGRVRLSAATTTAIGGLVGALLLVALVGEARTFVVYSNAQPSWRITLAMLAVVGVAAVWSGPWLQAGQRLRQIVLLLAIALLATVQIRTAIPLLGSGHDLMHQVEAARWIGRNTPSDARVLSASPGLLRLYLPDSPPERFLAFQDIESREWAEILAECRRRNVQYMIWHDRLFAEHGEYYAAKMGLARFTILDTPQRATGVCVMARYMNYPNLIIVKLE